MVRGRSCRGVRERHGPERCGNPEARTGDYWYVRCEPWREVGRPEDVHYRLYRNFSLGGSDQPDARPVIEGTQSMPSSTLTGPPRRPVAVLAVAVLLTAGVAACGSSDNPQSATGGPSASASAASVVVGVRDPWVKAADKGMTAAFGTLVNDGDADVTITNASTEVSPMELHEMTMKDGKMVMQAKQGGIVIKAKSTHVLEPGGDHLMLMDVRQPVQAGDELSFTLELRRRQDPDLHRRGQAVHRRPGELRPGHGGEPDAGDEHEPGLMTRQPASRPVSRRGLLTGGAVAAGGALAGVAAVAATYRSRSRDDGPIGAALGRRRRRRGRAVPRTPAGRRRHRPAGARRVRGAHPARRHRPGRRWAGCCGC